MHQLTQLQSTFLTDDVLAAASLPAYSRAFCCLINDNTICLVSALLLREDYWMEVVAAQHKMAIDEVSMSAVPRSSGGSFKPPNVLFILLKVAALSPLFDAVGLASFIADFPPCACAAGEAACRVLRQGGELVWFLDAIICMNSAVM
jgi:hypothetical protein